MVQGLGLDGKVRFVGPLYGPDRLAAYVDAQVLAYPAVHEIFGLVPFEALLCGTPVVVTDDCGCGHLISDAQAGDLVPYADVEALAKALRHALNNPEQSQRKVKAGQEYIRDRLNWEVIVGELENLYLEVIGSQ
jgi:glycosyltransferase involved in cell wall biosynthesis